MYYENKDIAAKREAEKAMVSLMIKLYCNKKQRHKKRSSAQNAQSLKAMQEAGVNIVRSWRIRLSVPTARFTAISRRCVRKYAKSCVSPDQE